MFELKPLSKDAIPRSLEKAERYRLLNEPRVAESICSDILRADPENQLALVMLILALTDQLGSGLAGVARQSLELIPRLRQEYERAYYTGIIYERQGKAKLTQGGPGSGFDAYELLYTAMHWFERAGELRPAGNEDAILHWNTCARMIMDHHLTSRVEERNLEPASE